jgi:hypothetical protein
MEPFTIETPVLRLGRDFFYSDETEVICKIELAKMYFLAGAKTISFLISTQKRRNAHEVMFERHQGDTYYHCTIHGVYKYLAAQTGRWLLRNTPLGTLAPGESATVYVTLYVHGELTMTTEQEQCDGCLAPPDDGDCYRCGCCGKKFCEECHWDGQWIDKETWFCHSCVQWGKEIFEDLEKNVKEQAND